MASPYIQISAKDDTKKLFDEFYQANKEHFGSKANMFRVMVFNLPNLAKINVKVVDPEKKKLEKELREAKEKIMEYELKLGKQKELKTELPEDVTDQLERIEKMVATIFESDLVTVSNKKENNSKFDFKF
ncbi:MULTISPECIES: hypothetical protein [Bacillota]|uniref:hypothetical protein n=1 Tax=Bacillota TaxID=1239 RepID=UPI000641404C|nr:MULTISPECIES: hypothetical protein [Bacillota]KLN95190.1 hypothetical protein ABT60_01365 [Enterococcus cecorum]QUD74565.1 hypothetical protein KB552_15155 [Clostridium perfringens]HAT4364623.1 hypothetical protein [Clostridium perfringens]